MKPLPDPLDRILVVKLGALGDFVQAMGPFQAIRRRFPDAEITLLTTSPFAEMGRRSCWFDKTMVDERPRALAGYWALRRRLIAGRFDMIYDLQTSDRSGHYWRMLWPRRPALSGIASGCSHPHDNPDRDRMHTIERQREQLAAAGIDDVPFPDTSWMQADLAGFDLPDRYALLVPGGAAHRPDKRWPVAAFAGLAARLAADGLTPVLLGAGADSDATGAIADSCTACRDLTGKTSLFEIAGLARSAALAVGNDTGPMHLAATAGCPALVLYSDASDPALCGQRGPCVEILRVPNLADLDPDRVWEATRKLAE